MKKKRGFKSSFVCAKCRKKNFYKPAGWRTRGFLLGVDKINRCRYCGRNNILDAEVAKKLWLKSTRKEAR